MQRGTVPCSRHLHGWLHYRHAEKVLFNRQGQVLHIEANVDGMFSSHWLFAHTSPYHTAPPALLPTCPHVSMHERSYADAVSCRNINQQHLHAPQYHAQFLLFLLCIRCPPILTSNPQQPSHSALSAGHIPLLLPQDLFTWRNQDSIHAKSNAHSPSIRSSTTEDKAVTPHTAACSSWLDAFRSSFLAPRCALSAPFFTACVTGLRTECR